MFYAPMQVGQGSFGVVRRANDGVSQLGEWPPTPLPPRHCRSRALTPSFPLHLPSPQDVAIKQLVRISADVGMLRRVLREIRVMSGIR